MLGRTVLGEATGMAWAHGQGTATAVDVVASMGACGGCVAARRGAREKRAGEARAGGGAKLAGRGAWPARWRRRRTAPLWAWCREEQR